MRTNNALQIIFAFFLGLVVVAFVGIGVSTFYPQPEWSENPPENAWSQWSLVTSIILLICATVLLAVSLFLPEHVGVLSNGVLLGGVFTMVYAVGMALSSERNVARFVVAAVALAVTIGIGWVKFARRRPDAVPPATQAAALGDGVPPTVPGSLEDRLALVEQKLDALGRALRS